MDPDELSTEADAWVEDGIITQEQANEILERYDGKDSASRFVLAISLMGAVLVGIGILWLLSTVWDDLPRWVRTAFLLGAPTGFAFGAHGIRGGYPRVGHALWFVAFAFVGASVHLLADLWIPDLSQEWLLLVWAAVALPAGHLKRSGPTTALGLLVLGSLVITLEDPTGAPIAIGFLGSVLLAVGIVAGMPSEDESKPTQSGFPSQIVAPVADVYRIVGVVAVLGTLLVHAAGEYGYDRISIEPTPVVLVTGGGAIVGVLATISIARRDSVRERDGVWVAIASLSVFIAAAVISLVPAIPAFLATIVVHASLLVAIVVTVRAGVDRGSTLLVNLAAIVFFLQILVFLATRVLEATSGGVALVGTGLFLLAIGVVLERGRRHLISRL